MSEIPDLSCGAGRRCGCEERGEERREGRGGKGERGREGKEKRGGKRSSLAL